MEERRTITTIREQLNPEMQKYLEAKGSDFQRRYEALVAIIKKRADLSSSAEVRDLMGKLDEREDPVSFELPEKPVGLPHSHGKGYHYFDYISLERSRRYVSAKRAYVNFNPLTNEELSNADLLSLVPANEHYRDIDDMLTRLENLAGLRQKERSEKQKEEREKVRESENKWLTGRASPYQTRRKRDDAADNSIKGATNSLSVQDKSKLAVLNVKADAMLRQSILLQTFCTKFSYARSFRHDELSGIPPIQEFCNTQIMELQELARAIYMQQLDPSKKDELEAQLNANQKELENHFYTLFDKAKKADIGTVLEWTTISQHFKHFLDTLNNLDSPDNNLPQWEIDQFKTLATWETTFRQSLMERFRYSRFSLSHDDKSVPVVKIGIVGDSDVDSYSLISRCCGGEPKKMSPGHQESFSLMGREITFEGQTLHMKFSNCARPEQRFKEIASAMYRNFNMFIIVCDLSDEMSIKSLNNWEAELSRFGGQGNKIFVALIDSNPALRQVNRSELEEKLDSLIGYNYKNYSFIVNPYSKNGGCEAIVKALATAYVEDHEEQFKDNVKPAPSPRAKSVPSSHTSTGWFRRHANSLLSFIGSNQPNVSLSNLKSKSSQTSGHETPKPGKK